MGKKPSSPAFGEEPGAAAAQVDPVDRDESREQTKILDILAGQTMAGGTIEIERRAINETDFGYLDSIPVENYSTETIKSVYGGGDYKFRAKSSRGTIVKNWKLRIDFKIPAKSPGGVAAANDQGGFAGAIKELKDMMAPIVAKVLQPAASGLSELTPILVAALGRPEPKNDTMQFMQLMLEQQRIAEQRNAERQEKAEERMMTLIKELRESTPQARSLKGQIEDLVALRDALPGGEGDGEKKTNWPEVIKALAPAAAPLMQHLMQNGQAQPMQPRLVGPGVPPMRPAVAAAHAGTGAPAAQPVDDSMNAQLQFILGKFRDSALEAAAKPDADAIEFARDTIRMVEMWAANRLPNVFAAANSEEWFSQIFGNSPEVLKHAEFLTQMRNAILARSVVFIARGEFNAGGLTPPAAVAQHILASLAPSFTKPGGYLFDETDPENWAALFEGEKIDPAWLESLRVALDTALDVKPEEPAIVMPPPKPAAAAIPTPPAAAGKKPATKARQS